MLNPAKSPRSDMCEHIDYPLQTLYYNIKNEYAHDKRSEIHSFARENKKESPENPLTITALIQLRVSQ